MLGVLKHLMFVIQETKQNEQYDSTRIGKVYLFGMRSVCCSCWACEVPFPQENTASWKDVFYFCCNMFCTTLIWQILSIACDIRSLQNGCESSSFRIHELGLMFCFCTVPDQGIHIKEYIWLCKSVIPHALYYIQSIPQMRDPTWSNPSQSHNMSARRPEVPDNRRPRTCTPKSLRT